MSDKLIHFENEAGFKALFEHATVGIIVADSEGNIVVANPNIEKLFGYAQFELEGEKVEKLLPNKYSTIHVAYRNHYQENPKPREMGSGKALFAKRKDGSVFPVEISLSSYQIESDRLSVAFITDVTKQRNYTKRLEEQVQERTEQLQKTLKKEQELSELKSKFIGIASHEFRTPLSTILSSAGLIDKYIDKGQTDAQKKHTSRIKSSVKNLNEILSDFLSLEKLEEGMVKNNSISFDLDSLIHSVLEEFEGILKNKQVIKLIMEPGSQNIEADPTLLKAVITNLLSNAVKYSAEGDSIELHVAVLDEIHITVKDQGMGIPTEDQENIFGRFYRASNALNIKGTGLGLNIIHRYVQIMGGKIIFESLPGHGTTFFVTLPHSFH